MNSGVDYVIVHDLPVTGRDNQETEKKKWKINLETVKHYLKIRDREELDIRLIAIPQATTYEDMLRQAKTYEALGIDTIGISLAPWIRPTGGVLGREKQLKQTIVELLEALRSALYTPIVVLGSQEPNLAR